MPDGRLHDGSPHDALTQKPFDPWWRSAWVEQFELGPRKWEDYKGTRFYNGDQALVIKRWLNRVDEDASYLHLRSGIQRARLIRLRSPWP